MTALHLASANGYSDIVKLLLANGADIKLENKWRVTPLHRASANGHIDVVTLLLEEIGDINEKRAYVNAQNGVARTALHDAARLGHLGVVALLLANGAAIEVKDLDGMTPLDLAKANGRPDIVKRLRQQAQQAEEAKKVLPLV